MAAATAREQSKPVLLFFPQRLSRVQHPLPAENEQGKGLSAQVAHRHAPAVRRHAQGLATVDRAEAEPCPLPWQLRVKRQPAALQPQAAKASR